MMKDSEEKFYITATIEFLSFLGVLKPTNNQIKIMQDILFNTWLKRKMIFDTRLTAREKTCLLLASHGKTSDGTADVLNISGGTVRNYEKEIIRKLGVKNMKQAIAIGIKYGELG